MSHNYLRKILISGPLILANIAFLFSFRGGSITFAQTDGKSRLASVVNIGNQASEALGILREVQVLEIDRADIRHPAALTFSAQSNAFHVMEMQQVSSTYADFVKMTPSADRAGSTQIAAAVQNPINMAFDNKLNRLLVLQAQSNQLLSMPEDINGNLNPAALTRYDAKSFGLQNPEGMTVDETSGTLFILDAVGPRIVQIKPRADGSFREAGVSEIDLQSYGFSTLRGIAFNPTSGHLFVINPAEQKLYELTQSGQLSVTRDLSQFGLKNSQAIVLAPSGDRTDDPSQLSLYVADSGQVTETNQTNQSTLSSGQIVELSLIQSATLPSGTTLLPATLIRTFDTSPAAWSASSPDPSGVDYWPPTGGLIIDDSEVDEMSNYFTGKNVYLSTLSGTLTSTCTTTPLNRSGWSNEPTGIAVNPNNLHLFISDDDQFKVFEVNLGPDGTYCTSDDSVTSINTTYDTEDVAYGNNTLYIADGADAEVSVMNLGPNGMLGGGDDGPMTHFDTAVLGFNDLEGIGYNTDSGTLFIVSTDSADRYLGEITTSGTLLRAYDLSFMGAAGNIRSDVAYIPSSQNPAVKDIYIVSRGIDNDSHPDENDGKGWEISIVAPPTATNTNTSTPTNTVTPGPSPTPTNMPTASGRPTITESRVASSSDDAEESASGNASLTSTDLELVYDGSNQTVGIRFNGVAIPQGAHVVNAYVQFKVDEVNTEAASLIVQGQATDSALTFIASNLNVSSRPRTAASVAWSPGGWTTVNEVGINQQTPNLSTIIQEIVSRPGWAGGNPLVIIITGAGHRTARAYDGEAAGAPLLHVEYDTLSSTQTQTATATTGTPASTFTPTATFTSTATSTPLLTNTPTPTATVTPTRTATNTPTATFTSTPTNTPLPDLIFADSFESGSLSSWSTSVTDGGNLSVSTAAALVGTRGMQAVINDNTSLYVTDEHPTAEPRYRVRFYFDPNTVVMARTNAHFIFNGFNAAGTAVVRVEFHILSGQYQIRVNVLNDSTSFTSTTWFTISDAPHAIELDWRASTAVGANDGGVTLWIDGVQMAHLTGVDNDTRRIDRVRLGATAAIDSGTRGTEYFDAFESHRQTYIGP